MFVSFPPILFLNAIFSLSLSFRIQLWIGDRVARTLSYGEVEALEESAAHYAYLAERFVSGQLPSSLLHVEVEKIRQAIGEPNVSLPSEKCSI